MKRFLSKIRRHVAIALGLVPLVLGCVSTIGKTPAVKCDIYQSRKTTWTAVSIAAASVAAGLATLALASKSASGEDAVKLGTLGASGAAVGFGYFGNESGTLAIQQCQAKQ